MGYFDTNIQRGVAEQIKHAETKTEKMIEWSMKGAEFGDKITFGYLWNASEFEIRDKRKDLKPGSEEFFNEVGKRLRDIIYSTQVVDSTLTRSEMMRSSDGRDKMLTAFASEPTLAYNMLQDAYMEMSLEARRLKQAGEKHSKKKAFAKHGKRMARVSSLFDVFAQHTSDMAKYNALALPVLDAFRWFNYKEKGQKGEQAFITKSVKTSIENAFGKDGQSYITTFLKDLNGQENVARDTLGNGFFKNAKIASVGANIRVALLQPNWIIAPS